MTDVTDVCIVVEGCYPYIAGGVSSWLDWLIRKQPDLRFSVVALTADDVPRDMKYKLPDNVVVFQRLALTPKALRPRRSGPRLDGASMAADLLDLWQRGSPDAMDRLARLANTPLPGGPLRFWRAPVRPRHADLIASQAAWSAMTLCYEALAPHASFADFFWTWRQVVGGLFALLQAPIPPARVYHAISTGYAGLFAVRAARETGSRCAVTEHGIYTNERRIDLVMADWIADSLPRGYGIDDSRGDMRDIYIAAFEGFARAIYASADKITALYGANQSFQRALGAENAKLQVIPNGIELDRFAGVTLLTEKPRPVVGLIGRVVPIKDIEALILAAAEIKRTVPNVEMLIIGPTDEDPAYFAACQARVAELDLGGTVTFMGRMNIVDVLPRLDVLLLSSISEAQPLVILEAGAAGIPCVATDVGSCRDIIEGAQGETPAFGRGGFVVPPMDPQALARATIDLLMDTALRDRCGRAMQQRVETHFTSGASAAQYGALYSGLMI